MFSLINEVIYHEFHGYGIVTKEFDDCVEIVYPDGFAELVTIEEIESILDY